MEPAKIDWKNIDSRFVEDELYEHINAPKWVDLSAPDEHVDDEAWFCRPECRHPKIAEDFLRSTPTSKAKHLRSISVSEILPLGDRNRKDANLKRRGLIPSSASSPRILKSDTTTPSKPPRRFQQDIENNNPNFSSPLQNYEAKIKKAAIKSSTERKKLLDDSPSHADTSQNDRYPQLKSTLSARNLFAGRDILNQITEFCNELKKLAMRAKEREKLEKSNAKKNAVDGEKSDQTCGGRGEESEKEKEEKKPLLGAEKENSEATEKSNGKEKQQKRPRKETDENEKVPQITVDVKNVKRGEESLSLQVRTCPPSPQCFSTPRARGPNCSTTTKPIATTPLRPSRPKPTAQQERGILQETKQQDNKAKQEEHGDRGTANRNRRLATAAAARTELKPLDMFWFLKPCTLSNREY